MYERLGAVEALEHRLQLSAVNVSILDGTAQESAGTLALQITFDVSPTSDIELYATTSDGTAIAGVHYTALSSVLVTIPAGADPADPIPITVDVGLIDDLEDNDDRTFNVSITPNCNPDVTIVDGDALATIDNDDDPTVPSDITDATDTTEPTDTVPVFDPSESYFYAPEDTPIGTVIHTLTASGGPITYSLTVNPLGLVAM